VTTTAWLLVKWNGIGRPIGWLGNLFLHPHYYLDCYCLLTGFEPRCPVCQKTVSACWAKAYRHGMWKIGWLGNSQIPQRLLLLRYSPRLLLWLTDWLCCVHTLSVLCERPSSSVPCYSSEGTWGSPHRHCRTAW
jgi:hypothetical protein